MTNDNVISIELQISTKRLEWKEVFFEKALNRPRIGVSMTIIRSLSIEDAAN